MRYFKYGETVMAKSLAFIKGFAKTVLGRVFEGQIE